jgi:hypothetical protein
MKKAASLIGLSILLLAALSAHALTVTAIAGADQTVLQSQFTPIVPEVRVTDSLGQPVAGATVTFTAVGYNSSNGSIFFPGPGFAFENDFTTTTDANGIATAGLGAIGYIAGPSGVDVTATTDGPLGKEAATTSIRFTVAAGGTTRFAVVSGSKQKTAPGTAFAAPWVAQALDANGQPVPYAAVLYYATDDATLPSVTFDGHNSVWVRADANGIAVSPIPVANMIEGKEEAFVSTLNYQVSVSNAYFDYTITTSGSASGGGGGGGGSGGGCGAQRKGNGNCGNGNGANHGK